LELCVSRYILSALKAFFKKRELDFFIVLRPFKK